MTSAPSYLARRASSYMGRTCEFKKEMDKIVFYNNFFRIIVYHFYHYFIALQRLIFIEFDEIELNLNCLDCTKIILKLFKIMPIKSRKM